jgi:hypothetical protein
VANIIYLKIRFIQNFRYQEFLPKRILELWMISAYEMVVEEDEAEVVAAAIHFPGVIGVFHERLQILLANRNRRENVA